MKTTLIILQGLLILMVNQVSGQNHNREHQDFSFAFFTDIHLNRSHIDDTHAGFQGIRLAIDNAKSEGVDFILTGGDNVDVDAIKKGDEEVAHVLYGKYAEIIDQAGVEYYVTIGNHDRYWACDKADPLHNDGLFEKYLNKSYYSFNHKGWHFIVLNSTKICDGKYCVDEVQQQWLKKDLESVNENTPIVVSTHVPFLSVYYPALQGKYTAADTFSNFKEVWDMFGGKNLKLVLQGHMHLYEEIRVKGVTFITAGAVSASWWGGDYHGTEEGYLKVNVHGDAFDWEYVDFGWEVKK